MNQFGSGRKMSLVGVETSTGTSTAELLPVVTSVSGVAAAQVTSVLPLFNSSAFVSTLMGVIMAEASEEAFEEATASPGLEERHTRVFDVAFPDVALVGRHMVVSILATLMCDADGDVVVLE